MKSLIYLLSSGLVFLVGLVVLLSQTGKIHFLSVESGSMSPAIKKGSLILVLPSRQLASPLPAILPQYQKGEIITYSSGKENYTHRIVSLEYSKGEFVYTTKGDLNRDSDIEKVTEKQALGKMIFSLPYLGYPISFAKTQIGYIFLIIVPATIIVYSEILNIGKEIKKILVKRKVEELA